MEKVEIKEELVEKLKNIFEDKRYFNDIKLINSLSNSFVENKMPRDIPNKLFMELMTWEQLTEAELITLVQGFYDYEVDDKKIFPDLMPQNFFSDVKIIDAQEYMPNTEYVSELVFENVEKIEGHNAYRCFVRATDIAIIKKSEIFSYEFETQRPARLRKIGTKNTYVKETFLDMKSVKKISNLLYNNKYLPDQITMNIPKLKGNTPDVSYNKDTKVLTIVPHYDTTKNNITRCNITDGWHRINASEDAYDEKIKNGKDPKEITDGFNLLITIMTKEQAKEHFGRINSYNEIDKEYVNTFNVNNESKFINNLVNYSETNEKNIFDDNVLKTYEEVKAFNKLTYYKVLEDAVKETDIDTTNVLAEMDTIPIIVKFITKFIDYVGELYFKNSNDVYGDIKKYTNLLDINIFIGYFKIAERIESENEIYKYIRLLEKALNNDNVKNDLKEMGLNNKNYSAKKISDYFNELF